MVSEDTIDCIENFANYLDSDEMPIKKGPH